MFYEFVIDGITNRVDLVSFCIGEEIKYGGGQVLSYLFFSIICPCYCSLLHKMAYSIAELVRWL